MRILLANDDGIYSPGLAALASTLVSSLNTGNAIAMTATIGICGIGAFLVLQLLIQPKSRTDFAVAEEHTTIG